MEENRFDEEIIDIDRLEVVTGGKSNHTKIAEFHRTFFEGMVKKFKNDNLSVEETIDACHELIYKNYHKQIYASGAIEECIKEIWTKI